MKKSKLSIDVEVYLADQGCFGRSTGGEKPEFAIVFGILHLFTSFCI